MSKNVLEFPKDRFHLGEYPSILTKRTPYATHIMTDFIGRYTTSLTNDISLNMFADIISLSILFAPAFLFITYTLMCIFTDSIMISIGVSLVAYFLGVINLLKRDTLIDLALKYILSFTYTFISSYFIDFIIMAIISFYKQSFWVIVGYLLTKIFGFFLKHMLEKILIIYTQKKYGVGISIHDYKVLLKVYEFYSKFSFPDFIQQFLYEYNLNLENND